ncbi:outer membrane beta-barrel protein [Brevundimonas goettingensis]|uniref:Outer membrane beta-barrel protein n=1 Tax=Brevundimonas goettingensis TaxID=2774190 RepID=A0A975GVI5_9CAUL|nr:outer membrane beta-barrel protein [Brevundimonas goettingensis]QTC91466.1 outer membrane beta-barrel protein [Brevundimonas goettingensis]
MSIVSRSLTVLIAMGAAAQAGTALAQSASSTLAQAQAQSGDMFARDRSVAVRDRPHPEYEAMGLPMGGFTVYPKLDIIGEYNDNVFATATGAVDDVILRLRPEIAVSTDWNRSSITAYARSTISQYAEYDSENTTDYDLGGAARLDVSRAMNIVGGASFGHQSEPRTTASSGSQSEKPIEYDVASGYIAATRTSGRVKMSGRADIRDFDYEDGYTSAGVVVDQDDRDRTNTSFTGRVDVALSPATALFVQATANDRDYDLPSTLTTAARDSSGYEILAGANFELGAVARGEIAAGYIEQNFDESVYKDLSGLGARASLEWFPTQLTTVTFTGARTIEDSAIIGSGGYVSTNLAVQVDHELQRNVILSGQVTYGNDDYDGIDRTDKRFGAQASATYLINRHLGASVAVSHYEQSSDGADNGVSFDMNKLMVSLVTQF